MKRQSAADWLRQGRFNRFVCQICEEHCDSDEGFQLHRVYHAVLTLTGELNSLRVDTNVSLEIFRTILKEMKAV